MMVETVNEGKAKYKIVSIGVGDFVKEIRKNRVGVVKDINTKLKEVDQAVKETALDGGKSWNALSKEKKIKFLNIFKKVAQ